MVLIIGISLFYIMKTKNEAKDKNVISNNDLESSYLNNEDITNQQKKDTTVQTKETSDDYFILYDGCEIKIETGVQDLSDAKISSETNKKYNTTYYNYENGKYVGETKGTFGEETYEGISHIDNVKRIAISEKYNAIPRTYTTINELPGQLIDMADYSSVNIQSIDLDNDGKVEYIVCYRVDYAKGEIGEGEPQASSGIMLFDSDYKKIADLISLENGFWANIKEEDKKIFLSLDDIEYIDIDNDGIMEIIIKVPTYEGAKISIIKYKNGEIEGETNFKASVIP